MSSSATTIVMKSVMMSVMGSNMSHGVGNAFILDIVTVFLFLLLTVTRSVEGHMSQNSFFYVVLPSESVIFVSSIIQSWVTSGLHGRPISRIFGDGQHLVPPIKREGWGVLPGSKRIKLGFFLSTLSTEVHSA